MRQHLILMFLLLAPIDVWAHPSYDPFDRPSYEDHGPVRELESTLRELQRELSSLTDRIERDDWMKGHKWLSNELYNLLKDTRSFERGMRERKQQEMQNALSWMMDKAANIQREMRKEAYPFEREWDRIFDLVIQLDRRFSRGDHRSRHDERRNVEEMRERARELERKSARVLYTARWAGAEGRSLHALERFADEARVFADRMRQDRVAPFEVQRDITRLDSMSRDADHAIRRMESSRRLEDEWRETLEALRRLVELVRDPRQGLVPLPL